MPQALNRLWPLYQASSSLVFHNAIFFVFYQQQAGLSPATIFLVTAYATALRAVLDLPFGALADRQSRRLCLVVGALGVFAGSLLLLIHPALPTVLIAETLFATATALRSGADSALLYDALRAAGALAEYPRNEGRGHAFSSIGSGAAAIGGGFLAAIDLRLAYAASVLAAAAAAILASRLPEAREHSSVASRRFDFGLLREASRRALETPGVRWTVALATFAVVVSHIYYYLQQPYLQTIHVPIWAFGLVFAATKGLTAMVASVAHRIDAALGERGTAALMGAVPAAGLGAMAVVAGPAGALPILTRGLLDGLWMPLVNVYMNRRAESHVRATTLSLMNVVSRLALAAALAVIGFAVSVLGLRATLSVCAGLAALAGAGLTLAAPRRSGPD